MNLSLFESISIFQIQSDSTIIDLRNAYYAQVKKYHPDIQKNLTDLTNAHEKMIIINEAKSVLESFWKENNSFKMLFDQREMPSRTKPYIDNQLDDISERFKERYRIHRERAKKALYVYYRYGLQNVAQREFGTGKRWYSEYRRYLEKALQDLIVLLKNVRQMKQYDDEGILEDLYNIFFKGFTFFETFLRSSKCTIMMDFADPVSERQIFLKYKEGSTLIDDVLKEFFLRKIEGEKIRAQFVNPNLTGATAIFSYLLKNFPDTSWLVEINIKAQLVMATVAYINEFY